MTRFKTVVRPFPAYEVRGHPESAWAVHGVDGSWVGVVSRVGREWRAWDDRRVKMHRGLKSRAEAVRALGGMES